MLTTLTSSVSFPPDTRKGWVALGFAGALIVMYLRRQKGPRPPKAKHFWIPLANAIEYGTNWKQFIDQNSGLGSIFTANLGGKNAHFINDLDFVNCTIVAKPQLFSWGDVLPEFGRKALRFQTSLQDLHFFTRWAHRALVGGKLRSLSSRLAPRMKSYMEGRITGNGQVRDLLDFVHNCVWSASTRALFGDYDGRLEQFHSQYVKWERSFYLYLAGIPDCFVREERNAQARLGEYLYHSLERCDKTDCVRELEDMSRSHLGADDAEVGRIYFTLLFALITNSQPATFWPLLHMLHDRRAMEEIQEEVHQVLESEEGWVSRTAKGMPELRPSTVAKMNKLHAYGIDVLRIHSSNSPVRVLSDETTVTLSDGSSFQLYKGEWVFTVAPHSDPAVYEEPERARFDRPAPIGTDGTQLRHTHMAFGMGNYICPGRFYAAAEANTMIALCLVGYDMELVHPKLPFPEHDWTRPGVGCMPLDPKFNNSLQMQVRFSPKFPSRPTTDASNVPAAA